jgi:tRNA A37 methylthiotransferase MiaB
MDAKAKKYYKQRTGISRPLNELDNAVIKMMEQYAKEKVKEVVKQIHSQSKDGAITSDWIGFKSFID